MIQVVDRALNVLETLARKPDETLALGDIAKAADLNPATCVRILRALTERRYVEQTGLRKGYRLGPMAYRLTGGQTLYRNDLVLAAEPEMKELAEQYGDVCVLGVLVGGRRFIIAETTGAASVRVRSEILYSESPFRVPTGRLLMAHLPVRELDALLENATFPLPGWPEMDDRSTLLAELARLRQENLLLCEENDIAAMAAPIEQNGQVVAALGFYLPLHRFSQDYRSSLPGDVDAAARNISAKLG